MVPDFDSGFIPLFYLVVEGLLFAVVLQRITNYAEAGLNAFFLYEVKRLLKAGNRICREVVSFMITIGLNLSDAADTAPGKTDSVSAVQRTNASTFLSVSSPFSFIYGM